ncbi:MAG: thymidine phosphorylase family protein [Alphaproteobacteria bacterium]|nr:thymidine phosphorylase family protein [Alphaproteobacteria bacterium]
MLKLKRVPIDTQREYVAFLSRDCAVYRAEGFKALAKIEVMADGKHVLATLNVVENGLIVGPDELGLSLQAFASMGLPEGAEVSIRQASPPESLEAVRAKIRGQTLEPQDYKAIIEDVAAHRYSQMELAAFLVSLAGFMTTGEVLALTRAMAGTGTRLSWPDPVVVDKHCVGGLPGNRTSMIVVPIVAAHGLPIPKSSSRAITSPSGTADTMEVLANVDIPLPRLREIVGAERGCLVWGGHMNLAPADDVLISVERPLNVDTPEQMVASILAKKAAAGSTHLLIDIPVGPTAKVRNQTEAIRLRKLFEFVGGAMGMQMVVIMSDGSQPIGHGIGPALEARDVMQVLRRDPAAPQDLREKSLELAGLLIDFDPKVKGGQGYAIAREILDSGRALTAMERIIAAQGPSHVPSALGKFTEEIPAPRAGTVSSIDCYRIARIARLAGAPMDKGSGLDLFKRVGDRVEAGETLYRIHAANKADFAFATALARENNGFGLD